MHGPTTGRADTEHSTDGEVANNRHESGPPKQRLAAVGLRASITRELRASSTPSTTKFSPPSTAVRRSPSRSAKRSRPTTQPIYDAVRESAVLEQAVANNAGPLPAEPSAPCSANWSAARGRCKRPIRVAYLGPEFTFSHLAAIERFGQSAEFVPVGTIAAVFEEVERGQVQFGVVPMENSTDGRVSDTLDCFSRSPVRICGELPAAHPSLPARRRHARRGPHGLQQTAATVAMPQLAGAPPAERRCRSGSSRRSQARAKGDRTLPASPVPRPASTTNCPCSCRTSKTIPTMSPGSPSSATATSVNSGHDKTALMFEIAHEPGALADAMAIFKRNRLNMTWIESFPIPGPAAGICSSSSSSATTTTPTPAGRSRR